jgi:hypothetical protein
MTVIPFKELHQADLYPDAIYCGGPNGQLRDEPLPPLLRVGNRGGIRQRGPGRAVELVALYSTGAHELWNDTIDRRSGVVVYHGDNEAPRGLLATKGNKLLRAIFERGFDDEKSRASTPPFFVFTSAEDPQVPTRSARFEGLAVPGAVTREEEDWLTAKWYKTPTHRFENYVVTLTLLDVSVVRRTWIDNLATDRLGDSAPTAFKHWVKTGQRRSLGSVG